MCFSPGDLRGGCTGKGIEMTKLELEAIRSLPLDYVKDGTCVTQHMGSVYAIETSLPLIVYRDGVWKEV